MSDYTYDVTCANGDCYTVNANCKSHARLRAFFKASQAYPGMTRSQFDRTITTIVRQGENLEETK